MRAHMRPARDTPGLAGWGNFSSFDQQLQVRVSSTLEWLQLITRHDQVSACDTEADYIKICLESKR